MQRNQSADTACATICPTFDVLRERVEASLRKPSSCEIINKRIRKYCNFSPLNSLVRRIVTLLWLGNVYCSVFGFGGSLSTVGLSGNLALGHTSLVSLL